MCEFALCLCGGRGGAPGASNTKDWESTAAAAATLTRGNSETFLATLSLDTKRKWESDEVALGVSGGYGDSTVNDVNTKNTEFLQGYGQYNRLFRTGSTARCGWTESMMRSPALITASRSAPWPVIT